LRQKKAHENEMDRIAGTRLTLEAQVRCPASLRVNFDADPVLQVNAIESANLNAETMLAMKKGADALKGIHSSLLVSHLQHILFTIPCLAVPCYARMGS
jgi:charged multivesicular body protein 4